MTERRYSSTEGSILKTKCQKPILFQFTNFWELQSKILHTIQTLKKNVFRNDKYLNTAVSKL
jgi:hypothetical protein